MTRRLTKSEISQRRVLDSAAKIFRDNGYAGTTMRAIADDAGLKAGSIYYHYKSKDELISAMLDLGMSSVIVAVKHALSMLPQEASAHERIRTAVYAHLSAIIEYGDYTLAARRVFGQVPEDLRVKNMHLRDQYAAMWQEILVVASTRGELRPTANLSLSRLFILGALNWTAEWYKPGGRTIAEVSDEFVAIILEGLIDRTKKQDYGVSAARAPVLSCPK